MVLEIPQLHSPTVVSTVSNGNAFLECTDISSQAVGETAWQLPESKLLLLLPDDWYQSNFRTLSHDNSKTQLCRAWNHRSHAHSILIAIALVRRSVQSFSFERLQ